MIKKQNPKGGSYFREMGKGKITGLWMAMMKFMNKSLHLANGKQNGVLALSPVAERVVSISKA